MAIIQNVENPSFNDCVVEYKGRHEYSLPILDGTFTDCVIKKCKLIEPDIRNSITMIDSSLVYDENTLISKGNFEWKFDNTQIINGEIEY